MTTRIERSLLQVIEHVAEQSAWVPVTEKLPPCIAYTNKEYLVYETLNNKVQHDYFVCSEDGSFPSFWNHYGDNVTHWRYMPKRPQEYEDA